jgi:probable rRNA maturation factor
MRKLVEKIFDVLEFQAQEVSIIFTSDRFIRKLNQKYRQVDQPTDVLAFAMREGPWSEIQSQILGDIVISIDTAKRQALEMGHNLNRELLILLIHGILHLIGYDHVGKEDAEKMHAMEEKLLKYMEAYVPSY